MPYFHPEFGFSTTPFKIIQCAFCGFEIAVEKNKHAIIGSIFCLQSDGFKEDAAYCSNKCFEKGKIP